MWMILKTFTYYLTKMFAKILLKNWLFQTFKLISIRFTQNENFLIRIHHYFQLLGYCAFLIYQLLVYIIHSFTNIFKKMWITYLKVLEILPFLILNCSYFRGNKLIIQI